MAIVVTHKEQGLGLDIHGGLPWTSASFTASASSLLVVSITSIDGGSGITYSLSSSPSLTWTKQADASSGSAFNAQAEIWTAPHASGGSTTVTVSASAGATFNADGNASIASVDEVTGFDAVTPIGLTNTSTLNGSNTGTLTYGIGGTVAAGNIALSTIACDGDHGAALVNGGSGWTELYKNQSGTSGWYRSTTQYIGGSVSNVDYGALNDPYQYASAVIEIKAPAGASDTLFVGGGLHFI